MYLRAQLWWEAVYQNDEVMQMNSLPPVACQGIAKCELLFFEGTIALANLQKVMACVFSISVTSQDEACLCAMTTDWRM